MLLPTTLSLTAAAALINLWLAIRVGKLRGSEKIFHGDGGHALLLRRMRAQANFIEYVPLTLILIAGIELSGKGGGWLPIVGAVFMFGRLLHPFGMDSESPAPTRAIGMMTTMLTLIGLAVMAVLIALGHY